MWRWRLLVLVAVLVALLVWAWETDRPSPAYPQGRFGSLVVEVVVLVGLVAGGVGIWLAVRRSSGGPPPDY